MAPAHGWHAQIEEFDNIKLGIKPRRYQFVVGFIRFGIGSEHSCITLIRWLHLWYSVFVSTTAHQIHRLVCFVCFPEITHLVWFRADVYLLALSYGAFLLLLWSLGLDRQDVESGRAPCGLRGSAFHASTHTHTHTYARTLHSPYIPTHIPTHSTYVPGHTCTLIPLLLSSIHVMVILYYIMYYIILYYIYTYIITHVHYTYMYIYIYIHVCIMYMCYNICVYII